MSRFRTLLAGVAVALAATLAAAAPASAHDALVGSTPAADEHLDAAPAQIVLTFSNDLLALEQNSGTAMTVVDESGRDWVAGAPVVAADTVTVPLETGMPGGTFHVTWKVVSSDGHPTSGEYSFSVAAPVPTAIPTPTAEPSPTRTVDATPIAAPVDGFPLVPVLWAIGILVVVIAVVGVILARRRHS